MATDTAARPDRALPAETPPSDRPAPGPGAPIRAFLVRAGLRRTAGAILCALLSLGLGSCASDPPRPPSPAELAGQRAKTLFVAPLNVALPMPAELGSSGLLVWRILIEHIEGAGKHVVTLDARTARRLWIESIRQVREDGGEESFESAVRVFTRRLAEQVEFEALVIPSLYVQNARIGPEAAHWDRARQPIEFIGRSRWTIEPPEQSTIEAASILVSIFDPEGREIQTSRTGLELIRHFEIETLKRRGHDRRRWVAVPDAPPIEDENRVRAAIAHSLHPFLPK